MQIRGRSPAQRSPALRLWLGKPVIGCNKGEKHCLEAWCLEFAFPSHSIINCDSQQAEA